MNILVLNKTDEIKASIRFAIREDAELLARLGRKTFHDAFVNYPQMPGADLELYLSEAFTISQITNELNEPQGTFLLAEIDGQAVGYAKLVTGERERDIIGKNPVKLKRLYNRQEFVGAGIGSCLLSHCLDEAGEKGHDTIWLSVWEHNQRAQAFYRKWNFKSCGIIVFQFGSTLLTDVLMQRSL